MPVHLNCSAGRNMSWNKETGQVSTQSCFSMWKKTNLELRKSQGRFTKLTLSLPVNYFWALCYLLPHPKLTLSLNYFWALCYLLPHPKLSLKWMQIKHTFNTIL